jgi:SAM-dependent methyltransferase
VKLASFLAEPLTRGLHVDDPRTTELRLQILNRKPLVRRIYDDWYRMIRARIPDGGGGVLELGSGSGYLRKFVPEVIQSEVLPCSNADILVDACRMPFSSGSLKAIAMTDVFHHIPCADAFLRESSRCLRPGGRIIMIEPWVSLWSRVIWKRHWEPFVPEAPSWEIPRGGPLSGANGALPWVVFVRDRKLLAAKFPEFTIEETLPMMPVSFLISGGLSFRSPVPAGAYPLLQGIERMLSPWMDRLGMFALFRIVKNSI